MLWRDGQRHAGQQLLARRRTETSMNSMSARLAARSWLGDERPNHRVHVGLHLALEPVGGERTGGDVTDRVDLHPGLLAQHVQEGRRERRFTEDDLDLLVLRSWTMSRSSAADGVKPCAGCTTPATSRPNSWSR